MSIDRQHLRGQPGQYRAQAEREAFAANAPARMFCKVCYWTWCGVNTVCPHGHGTMTDITVFFAELAKGV